MSLNSRLMRIVLDLEELIEDIRYNVDEKQRLKEIAQELEVMYLSEVWSE